MRTATPCHICAGSGPSRCTPIPSAASIQAGARRAWMRLKRNSYRNGRGASVSCFSALASSRSFSLTPIMALSGVRSYSWRPGLDGIPRLRRIGRVRARTSVKDNFGKTRLFEAGSAKGFGVFFHCVVRGPDCILLDPALRYFRQYAFECPKGPLGVVDLSMESQVHDQTAVRGR